MHASSRTPDGLPNRCPVCGQAVRVEPSIPPGDAPCPFCGHLLWFDRPSVRPSTRVPQEATPAEASTSVWEFPPLPRKKRPALDPDKLNWVLCGAIGALVILAADGGVLDALGWLTGSLAFGWAAHPRLIRWAERVSARCHCFWLDVVFGWGLGIGPPVGGLLGVCLPVLFGWPISAIVGGLIGLVVSPLLYSLEGLAIAGLVVIVGRVFFGRRLDLM
jgi:hypothetical protein